MSLKETNVVRIIAGQSTDSTNYVISHYYYLELDYSTGVMGSIIKINTFSNMYKAMFYNDNLYFVGGVTTVTDS